MKLNAIKDINQVEPRSAKDNQLFAELSEVLKKHNALDRFGITLLHTHFHVGEDEIMMEENDPLERTLSMRTMKKSELKNIEFSETSWRLGPGGEIIMGCACKKYGDEHSHQHKR